MFIHRGLKKNTKIVVKTHAIKRSFNSVHIQVNLPLRKFVGEITLEDLVFIEGRF